MHAQLAQIINVLIIKYFYCFKLYIAVCMINGSRAESKEQNINLWTLIYDSTIIGCAKVCKYKQRSMQRHWEDFWDGVGQTIIKQRQFVTVKNKYIHCNQHLYFITKFWLTVWYLGYAGYIVKMYCQWQDLDTTARFMFWFSLNPVHKVVLFIYFTLTGGIIFTLYIYLNSMRSLFLVS